MMAAESRWSFAKDFGNLPRCAFIRMQFKISEIWVARSYEEIELDLTPDESLRLAYARQNT